MSASRSLQTSMPVARQGASAADLGLVPGEVLGGKYRIVNLIGEGGMGYVMAATHVELGELVALKFLRPEAMQFQELVGRFAREAQASARIRSEHVARVYDVGTTPQGVPYIVMEHLQGQDLASLLETGSRLSVETAVDYVMQACEGLASAHALGIVHRDIKPENLFLTTPAPGAPSVIKLLDFGISKVDLTMPQPQGSRAMAQTTTLLGSPRYMSPEQIRNSTQVDARADIWALGCVLYELFTGHPAYNAPSLMELGAAILGDDPVPVRVLASSVPVELDAIVTRCLQKRPTDRYNNIAELAAALLPYAPKRARMFAERCQSLLQCVHPELADLSLPSVTPPSSTTSVTLDQLSTSATIAQPPAKRRSNKLAAAVFVTTAAVAAGVFVTSRNSTRDTNTATAVAAQPGSNPSLLTVSGAATPMPAPTTHVASAPVVKTESLENVPPKQEVPAPSASSAAATAQPSVAVAAPRRAWRPPPPRPVGRPVPAAPAKPASGDPDVGF
jgi:eukaryotic-like serine/threonine-protein kinase